MRSLVCALVILVGCSKGSGVQLDIKGAPDGVVKLRVYLSDTPVSDVPFLSVPALNADGSVGSDTTTASPQVFVRTSDNENDLYDYKPGELNLKFEAGSNVDVFPAVIVIGFDANDKPLGSAVVTNLEFQPNTVNEYDVKLHAAASMFLWSPNLTTPLINAACVGVGGDQPTFIVSGGDTDCDGYPDGSTALGSYECNPFVYKDLVSMANLTDGQCLQIGDPSDPGECRLGGGTCADGSGPAATSETCNTSDNICMLSADCACQSTGTDTALDCLLGRAITTGDPTLVAYACTIGMTTNGGMPACAIDIPRPPTGGFGCVPQGGNSETGVATDGDGTFDNQVKLDGVNYALDVTPSCEITLTPNGSSPMSMNQAGVLLRLQLDDPDGPSSLVLPISVAFSGGSCDTSMCTPNTALTGPPLTKCASGWGTPTDSGLVGTSPTLNASMTEIFFIPGKLTVVERATRATVADAWGTPVDAGLGSLMDPVFVHLSDNDTVLYVVDATGELHEFTRPSATTSTTWTEQATGTLPPLTINAFAPDNSDQDAIVAAVDGNLYELADGMTLGSGAAQGVALSSGQTPFLTDDDDNVWYADTPQGTPGGPYSIFVTSRTMKGQAFSTAVELDELGTSSVPQAPWLSSQLTTMFFASDLGVANGDVHIYSTTR
jgi:hypothetical protein